MNFDSSKNYYEILGVTKDASAENMERRLRAARYGLTINGVTYTEDRETDPYKLQQMEEAYKVLSNPVTRKAYDEFLVTQENESIKETQAEARRAQEEETRRTQEEEVRRAQEEEARRAQEEEARRAQEEEARRAQEEEARKTQEEEARRAQEEEARRTQEEEARRTQEEEARRAQEEMVRKANEAVRKRNQELKEALELAKKEAEEAIKNATEVVSNLHNIASLDEQNAIIDKIRSLNGVMQTDNIDDIKSETEALNIAVLEFKSKYEKSGEFEKIVEPKKPEEKKEESDKTSEPDKKEYSNPYTHLDLLDKEKTPIKKHRVLLSIGKFVPGAVMFGGASLLFVPAAIPATAIATVFGVGALIGGTASTLLLSKVQKFRATRESYTGKIFGLSTAESEQYRIINEQFKNNVDKILADPEISNYKVAIEAQKLSAQMAMLDFRISERKAKKVKKGHWTSQHLALKALKNQRQDMQNSLDKLAKRFGLESSQDLMNLEKAKDIKLPSGAKETKLQELNKEIAEAETGIYEKVVRSENKRKATVAGLEIKRGWWEFCRKFPEFKYRLGNHSFNTPGVRIRKGISGLVGMFGQTNGLTDLFSKEEVTIESSEDKPKSR